MSGSAVMAAGAVLLFLSTAVTAAAEWLLHRKKKRIREQIYHIYE